MNGLRSHRPGHRSLVRHRRRHRPAPRRPGNDGGPGRPTGGQARADGGRLPGRCPPVAGVGRRSVRSGRGGRPQPAHLGRARTARHHHQQRRHPHAAACRPVDHGRGRAGHDRQLLLPGGHHLGPAPGTAGPGFGNHRQRLEPRGPAGNRHRGGLQRVEIRAGRMERGVGRRPGRHRRLGPAGPARGHRHRDLGPARQRSAHLCRTVGPGRGGRRRHRRGASTATCSSTISPTCGPWSR